jgi:hypothetical protein
MSERMYWGLLVFVLIVLWLLFGEIRRYIVLRMKLNALDLLQKAQVAAIAAKRHDLPENDTELTGYTYTFAWPPSKTKKKILLLSGITLIMGSVGTAAALYWAQRSDDASFALIPLCVGFGMLIYLLAVSHLWK